MPKKTETRPATGHIAPFGLRMQPDLRAHLESAAVANGRSLNAEITARLEQSLTQEQQLPSAVMVDMIAMTDRLNRMTAEMDKTQARLEAALKEITAATINSRKKERA